MRLGFRWRIAIPYIAVVICTMVALNVYLAQQLRATRIREYKTRLRAEAALVLCLLEGDGHIEPSPTAAEFMALWSSALGTRITLIAPDGTVLADTYADPAAMDNHGDRPEVQQALATGYGSAIRFSATAGYDMLYVTLRAGEAGAPAGVVRCSLPLREVAESIGHLQRALTAAALAASLIVFVLSLVIAHRIARPLRRLTSKVRSFPLAIEDAGVGSTGYDEVDSLATAFRRMSSELNARMATLAEERNKMSTVLAHLTDGVVITDPEGRLALINPAARRLLGLDPHATLDGLPLPEAVGEENVLLVWRQCRATGEEHETMIDMPGEGTFLRAVAKPLSGIPAGGELLVLQDLSQVRRLETIRRDFISNISHELRTPLASLKALVDTLQDGALEDPGAARGFLQRMEIEVDSLTQMVQELLELSRIESGLAPIRLSRIKLSDILEAPLERLHPQAQRANLRLTVNLPPEPLTVMADGDRIRQVVSNIVHNAIKFTPAGGEITITAARSSSEAVVSVADTGVGIPERDLPRIFERFYKADRARGSGGTGLGLAIAKHIVQAHGGRIWAESREGLGSTFHFALPLAD